MHNHTLIATAEGPIEIQNLKAGNLVYSYDYDNGMVLKPCAGAYITKHNTPAIELITDKGLAIDASETHPFMLRNSEYRPLKDITKGTPLMPLSVYKKGAYAIIQLHNLKDTYKPVHRWLLEQVGITGPIVHHINGNSLDNRISNLAVMASRSAHSALHYRQMMADGTHPFLKMSKLDRSNAVKKGNISRIKEGTHNFLGNRNPAKNPIIRLQQMKTKLANIIWTIKAEGFNPTADTIEDYETLCDNGKTRKAKLETYIKVFGSFENALEYADSRNNKAVLLTPIANTIDAWNIDVEDTHNYVVCSPDLMHGIVVSSRV